MIFLIVISFYTSRLLLSALGVEDFGIQSVVGSISSTFMSLKALFSESVQRFLNFEKGKESLEGQQKVFSISIWIHLALAFIFVTLVEIVGCWLISNKLEIPPEKIQTAFFVFHCNVIAIFISIFSIPYDALIIANEKMGTYAFVSIIDAILRLIAVIIISYYAYNKLKLYAALLIIIPSFTLVYQLIYCRRFPECKISRKVDKPLLRNVLSLSGWNFFGNMSFSVLHEGVNMLLNMFGGLVYNASRTVAYQVKGVASNLTYNTLVSVRPRVMQQAASEDKKITFSNINAVSRIAVLTIFLPVSILCPYTYQLLDLWLVDVPESATLFTQLILISVVVRSMHEPLNMLFMAFGKLKRMMLIEAGIMLSSLFVIFLSLKNNAAIWIPFLELGLMEVLIIIGLLINAKTELGFSIKAYLKDVVSLFLVSTVTVLTISFLLNVFATPNSIFGVICLSFISGIVYSIVAYLMLNDRERSIILNMLAKILKHK